MRAPRPGEEARQTRIGLMAQEPHTVLRAVVANLFIQTNEFFQIINPLSMAIERDVDHHWGVFVMMIYQINGYDAIIGVEIL
jgi:hypothetical protein